jgi:hypothetical protein
MESASSNQLPRSSSLKDNRENAGNGISSGHVAFLLLSLFIEIAS